MVTTSKQSEHDILQPLGKIFLLRSNPGNLQFNANCWPMMNWQPLASSQSTGSSSQLGLWVYLLVITQGKDWSALALSFAGKTWHAVGCFPPTYTSWPKWWIMDSSSAENSLTIIMFYDNTQSRSEFLLWKYLITRHLTGEIWLNTLLY